MTSSRWLSFWLTTFSGFCGKGFPMRTSSAPLLADIFLYSYEAEFIQSLLSNGRKPLASRFNFKYRYIDDVLSIKITRSLRITLARCIPLNLRSKAQQRASLLLLTWIYFCRSGNGQLHTSIYDKRYDFNFHITNILFLSSNIPASSAYGVSISQLIQYARACSSYECFILRATRLSNKLLEQGYVRKRLKSSLKKFLVDTGILSNNTKFLSHECLMTFCSLTKYNDNPPQSRFYTNLWPFYRTRPSTDLREVSIEHLRRASHTDRGRLLPGHLVPSHLGLAYVLLVETNPFPEHIFFRTIHFEHPSVLSRFCFLSPYKDWAWTTR